VVQKQTSSEIASYSLNIVRGAKEIETNYSFFFFLKALKE